MCTKCKSKDVRAIRETRNCVISTVYICDWCRCRFVARQEKSAPYAVRYTKQIEMKEDMNFQNTAICTSPIGCGKTHLALNLTAKENRKHYDYIIIIYLML